MSAPRDQSPVGLRSSITSYREARPHPQALRKRNIIVPPLYFGMVAPKIYRRLVPHLISRTELTFDQRPSTATQLSLPRTTPPQNNHVPPPLFSPDDQRLMLILVRYLADQEYSPENISWCEKLGIRICHIKMQSAKEPFIENDPTLVAEALAQVLDSRNYPLLIHSNKGKHRWSGPCLSASKRAPGFPFCCLFVLIWSLWLTSSGVVVGCLRKLQGWSIASIFNEYDRYAQGKGESDLQFIERFEAKVEYDTIHKPDWIS